LWADGVTDSITHAVSMLQSGVSGNYGIRDAILDMMECSIRASKLGVDTLQAFGILPPSVAAQPNPTVVTVEVPVADEVGPLNLPTLENGQLRAIGWGNTFLIPADKVQIGAPTTGKDGITVVPVTVSFAGVNADARKLTLIYEGALTSQGPAGRPPVKYAVRVPKPRSE